MEQDTTYVGLDTSKETIAVAIAESGLRGEVRYYGSISSRPEAVSKLVAKLADRHRHLAFCYEAGPTGYGLYRQIRALGHDCQVVAPSLVPVRPGSHIKTDRRDAATLAALFRAGELTAIWVPDDAHEAMRDLSRARQTAMEAVRRSRQQLLPFLLRHGRSYATRSHWTRGHLIRIAPTTAKEDEPTVTNTAAHRRARWPVRATLGVIPRALATRAI